MLPTGPDPDVPGSLPAADRSADPDRFAAAIAAIDEANAEDPNVLVVDGVARPKELVHAEAMTRWVLRLDPDADEAQMLAARAHHFRRWTYPRSSEPEGRSAYLRWRTEAKRRQAAAVAELLRSKGYDDELIGRVRALVAKEGLGGGGLAAVDGRWPPVQTHEDALCLVFLTTQFEPVADQLGHDKMIAVLARTLAKMSERGRAVAFDLPFDDRARALVVAALDQRSEPDEVSEPSAPAGLDLLLAMPVDSLTEGEAHDDPEFLGATPVILVDSPPETRVGAGKAVPAVARLDGLEHPTPDPGGPTAIHPTPEASGSSKGAASPADGPAQTGSSSAGPASPLPRRTPRRAPVWGPRSHPPPVVAPPPFEGPTSTT